MSGLTTAQLKSFDRDGYLVVEDVLSAADLESIRTEYQEIIDRETDALDREDDDVPHEQSRGARARDVRYSDDHR